MHVAYTNHIGRSEHDKRAKSTNISSASDLAAAEKHNNHDYTKEEIEKIQSAINLDLKKFNKQYDENLNEVEYLNLTEKVKKIYKEEFSEAVEEYNAKQKRKDRRITNYFEQVSNDGKTDLCVEGIIQIGDMNDWKDKSLEDRERTRQIYLDTLRDMLREIPGLRLAGASFHINESSPHLHWIAVCVHERPEAKKGLRKVASKSAVLTQDVLGDILQTKIRNRMQARIRREFGWEFEIKKSGRNQDLSRNEMQNAKLQEQNRELQKEVRELQQQSIQMQQFIEETYDKIPDYPAYDQEASKAFRLLDELKNLMRESFGRNFIFRNRKAEQLLLSSVESLRDSILTSVAALRGFEARERVPEAQQRSRIIVSALDSRINSASEELRPKKRLEQKDKSKSFEH